MGSRVFVGKCAEGKKISVPIVTPAEGEKCIVVKQDNGDQVVTRLPTISVGDRVVVAKLQNGGKAAIPLKAGFPCCNWSWDGWTVYTNTPDSANFTEYHGIVEFVYSDGSWTTIPPGASESELCPPCYTKYANLDCKRLSTGYCGFVKPTPPVLPYHYDVETGMQRTLSTPITITGFRMYLFCDIQIPGSAYADVILNGIYIGRTYEGDGWGQVEFLSTDFPGGALDLSSIQIYRYSSAAFNGAFLILCSRIELEIGGKWVCFDSSA